jgi:Cys-rich protein (TIGR01571 family)
MTRKDQEQINEEVVNTVDTPGPQEIPPPPEAIIASQVPVETSEVAVPVFAGEISSSAIDPSTSPSRFTSSITIDEELPKFCTVIAPSSLEAGYSFPAKVDGIDFVVTVPEGGIREGQAFQVPYPKRTTQTTITASSVLEPLSIEQSRPGESRQEHVLGKWRRPLCECCEVCCTNCMCGYGFFCTPIMLAQIMTRLKLNVIGVRGQESLAHHTFWWVMGFWILFLLLFFLCISVDSVSIVVFVIFALYCTIASTNVRSAMRRRYNIPVECCGCCDGVMEDYCISLWCPSCSVIQMARHTHDIDKYPYHCCTKTGLGPDAPEIV